MENNSNHGIISIMPVTNDGPPNYYFKLKLQEDPASIYTDLMLTKVEVLSRFDITEEVFNSLIIHNLSAEEVKDIQLAAGLVKQLYEITSQLSALWVASDHHLLDEMLCSDYPSTLPSFDEFNSDVAQWSETVSAKADQICQNLTVSTPALINDTLAKDIIAGEFKYSNLTYTIEFDVHNKDWDLTIISSSSSELEGSNCGILETYYYKSEEDAKADIDAVAIITKCSFDRI